MTVSGPGVTRYVAVIAINDKGFGESAVVGGTSRTPVATAKPGPVQNLSVTAASFTQLTVTWSAPSNTGGHIDKYQIEASGTSNAAVPGAVQNLAVMGSFKSIFISWDAPSDNGGSAITKYEVEASTTENGTYSNTGVTHSPIDAKNAIVTGLGNSETRWVRVLAINRWGRGQWVKASGASKPVVPGAVQNLSATAGTGPNLTVTWAALASDGGNASTGYTVEATGDETYSTANVTHSPATALTATVTGLTVGETRSVRVAAFNEAAVGDWAMTSGTNTSRPPGQVWILYVDAISESAFTIVWKAPLDSGSSAITGYEIQSRAPSDETWDTTETLSADADSKTITGLSKGTTRMVRVRAVNTQGSPDVWATAIGGTWSEPGRRA